MKKILITSKSTETGFPGSFEVIYGERRPDGMRPLKSIDLGGATLKDKQLNWIIDMVPRYYGAGYAQAWGTDKLVLVDSDLEYDFEEDFWKVYGLKHNKKRTQGIWNRLSKADRARAVNAIPAYFRYLGRKGFRDKKEADGYLSNRFFETDWDNRTD